MERNEEGKFISTGDSMDKAIAYRLRKGQRDQFKAIAQSKCLTMAELTRVIVSKWLEEEGDRHD